MEAKKLEQQANTLRNQGKGYESIEKYQQAKERYLEDGNRAQAAGCQHMIGVSYKIENDIENAMPAYDQAIAEYREAGDLLGPGRVQRDIGIMYEYYDRLDEAKDHLMQSKIELESVPDDKKILQTVGESYSKDAELGITLAKLGLVDIRLEKLVTAKKYLMDGLSLICKAGHPFYEMTTLMHLGSLYFGAKHYDKMLINLQAALGLIYEYDMQEEQTRRLAQIWGLMAHGYLHRNNLETARHFAQKSFNIIDELSESAAAPVKKDIKSEELRQHLDI